MQHDDVTDVTQLDRQIASQNLSQSGRACMQCVPSTSDSGVKFMALEGQWLSGPVIVKETVWEG